MPKSCSPVIFRHGADQAVGAGVPVSNVCSSLPGLKRTAFPGVMLTSVPVRGLRPMPGFARANAEHAKTAQFNALTCCKGFFQALKHSVDCRFGLGAGQACALDHMVHDVLFNQSGHLASATVLDSTTPYRTDGTAFVSFVELRG